MNVQKVWEEIEYLSRDVHIDTITQEAMRVLRSTIYSPHSTFGSIKDVIINTPLEAIEEAIKNVMLLPTVEEGVEEELDPNTKRFALRGNLIHEIEELERVQNLIWRCTKKGKRTFF